jgi:hypothetical protein
MLVMNGLNGGENKLAILFKLQLPLNTTNLISWQKEICSELLTQN